MKPAFPLAVGLSIVFSTVGLSQTTQPVSDTPNLVHRRHEFPRNAKPLETVLDASRFDTIRNSLIQLKLPKEDASFTFAIFGDRTTGPADGVNILADAVRDVNLIEPDLVMTIGDLVQGYNETPTWLAEMREYKAIMNKLTMPWFPTAGNHDVYWRDRGISGETKPVGEHEKSYEAHFGPLWYAFEHKNCWFIVLYTDEGDKATNRKGFAEPDLQKMSDEQFNWLKATLAKAKGADHVFIFQHHPRWAGMSSDHGGYGDDWNRIHKLLVDNGNVRAVFGGHIHYMKNAEQDGIIYQTLATTGGSQGGQVPTAGQLHHYNLVTVRKDRVSMAAYPVGAALDIRSLSNVLVDETRALSQIEPVPDAPIRLNSDGSAQQTLSVTLKNPTKQTVRYTVSADSRDSRWEISEEPVTLTLAPGAQAKASFDIARDAGAIDKAVRLIEVTAAGEYATDTHNYPIPPVRIPIAIDTTSLAADLAITDRMLVLRDDAYVSIPARYTALPKDQFTLEARFRANSFKKRNGLVSKMQNSGFGIFVSNGHPTASVFIDGSYLTAGPAKTFKLDTDRWYHVAQVYDGKELRLYLDGKLLASAQRTGKIQDNRLPLIVGGDVEGNGSGADTLDGDIDDVRLSRSVRYQDKQFDLKGASSADEDTLILLDMNQPFGKWLLDQSAAQRPINLPKGPRFEPASR